MFFKRKVKRRTGKKLEDFTAFCFHLPFPKLGLKGLNSLFDKNLDKEVKDNLLENFHTSITYSRRIGNIYTGSLFLGLLSLLENSDNLKAGDKIALFSYGSGAVAEIFSASLVPGYENQLSRTRLEELDQRQALSVEEYERIFFAEAELDAEGNATFSGYEDQSFALAEIAEHQRKYIKVEKSS